MQFTETECFLLFTRFQGMSAVLVNALDGICHNLIPRLTFHKRAEIDVSHLFLETHTHTHIIEQRIEADVKHCRAIHSLSLLRSLSLSTFSLPIF